MANIYFWRQIFILCTSLFTSMGTGFMLAFPSVLNPAITSSNSTDIKTTVDHASWITAINGIGGLLGCFIISPIMQFLGRRACHIGINTFWLLGWIIFPLAENITALYAARFIQGIGVGGVYIEIFIVSEYVHPYRRGYFITLKKLSTAFGALCCHAMSVSLKWRHIAIFAGLMPFMAILLTLFWPESPPHLALKGKFSECERSFKWLNGNSEESQKQLKALVAAQRRRISRKRIESNGLIALAMKFLKKDFQKAFLISSVLTLSVDVCGRYYYMAYIIQIMMELMDNKTSAFYFTLGADLLTLTSLSISTVVIKYTKRRTILFCSGAFSVMLMLLISLLAYLKSIYTVPTSVLWFTALMVIFQSFIVNIGVIPISVAIIGEIFPLEHKGFGSFASSFVFTSLYAAVLKITPVLMEHTKLYGTYGIFGVILAVCMMILYKTVPETKDKTLQEIEDELNDVTRNEIIEMERNQLMYS